MADAEAGISMRSWGWLARKKTDAIICPQCKYVVVPGGKPGTFDFPEVQIQLSPGVVIVMSVEVKAGVTSFQFSELREEQREWATNISNYKMIWLCLGKGRANSAVDPRITYFFPYELFLELEETLERKSIPYGLFQLEEYKLTWSGKKCWDLPIGHPQHWMLGKI